MAKHKYIETPEKMDALFVGYREHTKGNPRIRVEYVGRNGDRVETPLDTPLTMEGFRVYARKQGYSIEHYFANTDGKYGEYRTVCRAIRDEIRQDQIEGGMVGQYNASITQRLNGLTDKSESSVTVGGPIFKGINLDVSEDNSTSEDSEPKS
jgi:hypothetical protein